MSLLKPVGSGLKEATMHHLIQTPSTYQSKEKFQKFGKSIFEILLHT